jgi:uncharacterized protein YfaT (DUF1175 family)
MALPSSRSSSEVGQEMKVYTKDLSPGDVLVYDRSECIYFIIHMTHVKYNSSHYEMTYMSTDENGMNISCVISLDEISAWFPDQYLKWNE